MSFGAIAGWTFGILAPISLLCACIGEFLARRMAKKNRCDQKRLARLRQLSDICLVAAWLLLAAAYLSFQYLASDREALEDGFRSFVTWILIALAVLDIPLLYLRRARPRPAGKKKHFWEI